MSFEKYLPKKSAAKNLVVFVRLPNRELHSKLKALAAKNCVSINALATAIIQAALEEEERSDGN